MSKRKVKVEYESPCCMPMMYGAGGFGGGGQVGYGGGGYAGASWGIRWIYALLILIVIVLQFGRRECVNVPVRRECGEEVDGVSTGFGGFFGCNDGSLIDRSVLFIIVVFLLVLCTGCWWGGGGAGYAGGYGYGSGYGY